MFFITLGKMKGEMTPAFVEATQISCKSPPPGIKYHNIFWTLGQFDFVIIYEAPDEKEALKWAIPWAEFCETQTMVAVLHEEALKLFK